MKINEWKLKEWNDEYSTEEGRRIPMTNEEIERAIKYLRKSNYPVPMDCPGKDCPKYRPACLLGTCRIAVGMCEICNGTGKVENTKGEGDKDG